MSKKSLYPPKEYGCFICGYPYVEQHHIYPSARRKTSDEEGCTVYLCHEHHQGSTGAHQDRGLDRWLKADCQRRWEKREKAGHEEFRKVFYESYL